MALSLSAIAARAGTTTAAIYRRWSGKAQLVHEAILPAEVMAMPSASGDVEEDIRALVEATRTMFYCPEVRAALPALIADTVADPDVHSRMISRFAGSLATFRTRLDQRPDPGGDDGDLPLLAEVVVGSAIFRIIIRMTPRWRRCVGGRPHRCHQLGLTSISRARIGRRAVTAAE